MLLKSVEIQGFKSFPDRVKLQLGKGITAIVGPNGSGKSNISDAVKWVLGEQSTKSLRGTKMEDVIFGGTSLRKSSGYAYVNLVIDNYDKKLLIEDTEVLIGRKLYRSGESEYTINGKSVRLKDVHELFMDTGLGRDGYSIIGQGKVDEVISTKSEERRDIFEEAAGISRFRYRKEEAQRRLKQTNENLLRLNDIALELENRVEPLRIQSENAKKFLALSEEKSTLSIGISMHKLRGLKNSMRELDNKLTQLQAQKNEYDDYLTNLDEQLELLSQQSRQIAIDIDNARKQLAELDESSGQYKSQIAVLDNDIGHTQKDIDRVTDETGSNDRLIEQNNFVLQENEKKIKELQLTKSLLEDKLDKTKKKYNDLTQNHDEINTEHDDLNNKYSELSIKLAELRVELIQLNNEAESLAEKTSLSDNEVTPIADSIIEYTEKCNIKNSELDVIKQYIADNNNKISGLNIKLENKSAKFKAAKTEVTQIKEELLKSRQQVKILRDLEMSNEGFSRSAKAVLDGANNRSLGGVRGAVSKIIAVPDEYATAIEIALGAALQNIIVDSENDAKLCIDFLKQRNLGRCTFLPLSSIKPSTLNVNGLEQTQGFLGYANQLVSCDDIYKNIVAFLLGRTVIVDDINAAIRIAKQNNYKFKIVTLDGQVVNYGGSMTGGSHTAGNGIFSRKSKIESLDNEIRNKEKLQFNLDEQLNAMRDEINMFEANIKAANAENENNKNQEQQLQLVIQGYNITIENKQTELERIGEQKRSLEHRSIEINNNITDTKNNTKEYEAKISKLKNSIEKFSDTRQSVAVQIDELSKQSQDLTLELLSVESQISNENYKIDSIKNAIQIHNKSIENQKLHINELHNKIKDYEELKLQLIKTGEQIEEKIQSLNNKIKQSIGESSAIEGQQNEIRKNDKQYFSMRENIVLEQARISERKNTNKNEYNETVTHIYDEYNITLSQLEDRELPDLDIKVATIRINKIKNDIKTLGSVNVSAIDEYEEVSERYNTLSKQIEDIELSRDEINKLIKILNNDMQIAFLEKFHIINSNFSIIFKELFGGGTAKLELTNADDVLNTGIDIIVQPPGKKVSIIEQFSGGEKALIAIAIYFAIIKVNPPPFCLLDEVEAALDDINVNRFAVFLRQMADDIQFILVSHRRGTMEEADVLYGVTMQERGVSTILKLDINELEHSEKYIK